MNIIFPINGLGKRFENEGYKKPKPLIPIGGTPMFFHVLENLIFDPSDKIYILYNRALANFNFEDLIREKVDFGLLHKDNIHFVKLNKDTNGAVETILEGTKGLDLRGKTIFLDCDTIYFDDILSSIRNAFFNKIFFTRKDGNEPPIYSYIQRNEITGQVTSIREKQKISTLANTGAYFFMDFAEFKRVGERLIGDEKKEKNEYYISSVYKELIEGENKQIVASQEVKSFSCVGTPLELRQHCLIYNGDKKRFCFDLDNTLVTYPKIKGDYSSVEPIIRNINMVKFLHKNGHHVIIATARRMKTHKGNVGGVIADIGQITLDTLKKFNIPYDEIYFGKPYADFYIDDLAVNQTVDNMEKEMGFYQNEVEPRSFHQIEDLNNGFIEKTGEDLSGETYWYDRIKNEVFLNPTFFPNVISSNKKKIVMNKINGVNLSHIFINGGLNKEILRNLLDILTYKLHIFSRQSGVDTCSFDTYKHNLINRYRKMEQVPRVSNVFNQIMNYLVDLDGKRIVLNVIHGDPVMSNVLVTKGDKDSCNILYLIDPKGKWGDELSIYGDKNYDLAKVYQSILGYDFVINDKEVDIGIVKNAEVIYRDLLSEFGYTEEEINHIKKLACYLLFTLIPLHDKSRQDKFLELIERNF